MAKIVEKERIRLSAIAQKPDAFSSHAAGDLVDGVA